MCEREVEEHHGAGVLRAMAPSANSCCRFVPGLNQELLSDFLKISSKFSIKKRQEPPKAALTAQTLPFLIQIEPKTYKKLIKKWPPPLLCDSG